MMFRKLNDELEVFLVHPGGPLWTKKDKGAWTISKGEYEQNENSARPQRVASSRKRQVFTRPENSSIKAQSSRRVER